MSPVLACVICYELSLLADKIHPLKPRLEGRSGMVKGVLKVRLKVPQSQKKLRATRAVKSRDLCMVYRSGAVIRGATLWRVVVFQ